MVVFFQRTAAAHGRRPPFRSLCPAGHSRLQSDRSFCSVRQPGLPLLRCRARGVFMNAKVTVAMLIILALGIAVPAHAQELGGAGTIQGTEKEPTVAVLRAATRTSG